jgi:hypothetical protein
VPGIDVFRLRCSRLAFLPGTDCLDSGWRMASDRLAEPIWCTGSLVLESSKAERTLLRSELGRSEAEDEDDQNSLAAGDGALEADEAEAVRLIRATEEGSRSNCPDPHDTSASDDPETPSCSEQSWRKLDFKLRYPVESY